MDQILPSQGITGDQLQQPIQRVQHLINGLNSMSLMDARCTASDTQCETG